MYLFACMSFKAANIQTRPYSKGRMFYTRFKHVAITQKSLLSHPLLLNQYLLGSILTILEEENLKSKRYKMFAYRRILILS